MVVVVLLLLLPYFFFWCCESGERFFFFQTVTGFLRFVTKTIMMISKITAKLTPPMIAYSLVLFCAPTALVSDDVGESPRKILINPLDGAGAGVGVDAGAGAGAGAGHAGALHGDDCVKVGHWTPPLEACVVTVLVWVWVPVVPQAVALHELRGPQADTTQSTGHGAALHGVLFDSGGHGAPPFAG